MILYVNGDSHAAAAEAVNCHAFAEDDHRYFYMGRVPHPDNSAVSWGKRLSDVIKTTYKCDAESASSNTRILRTTRQWLKDIDLSTTEGRGTCWLKFNFSNPTIIDRPLFAMQNY